MRIRQVKPEFWRDEKVRRLSLGARLFFIGLLGEADDSGWLRWRPDEIAADLFPGETEHWAAIPGWADELRGQRMLRTFACGHGVIPHLPEHQHLAGSTKQVHTVLSEHSKCRARHSPRFPAVPRGSPPWSGQVRSGQVSYQTRAHAHEGNGVGEKNPVEELKALWENATTPEMRNRYARTARNRYGVTFD